MRDGLHTRIVRYDRRRFAGLRRLAGGVGNTNRGSEFTGLGDTGVLKGAEVAAAMDGHRVLAA